MQATKRSSTVEPITPPGSAIASPTCPIVERHPLTPPPSKDDAPKPTKKPASRRVTQVLSSLRKLYDGVQQNLNPWTVIPFTAAEFSDLRRRLDEGGLRGFFGDKVRYDFDSSHQKLILRMPTSVHDTFRSGIEHHILSELKGLATREDDVGRFATRVVGKGSSRIAFLKPTVTGSTSTTTTETTGDERHPDAAFAHERNKYPGVIIEVSYAQKRKALRKLAKQYILQSEGSIRVVVGLDIDYGRPSKRATLSVWRPDLHTSEDGQVIFTVAQPIEDEEFRTVDGSLNPSAAELRLHLRDFTTTPVFLSSGSPDATIELTAADLFNYLETAERSEAAEEHGEVQPMPAGALKRGLESSSPERSASADEAEWDAAEERAAKRVQLDDSSYHESSSESVGSI
ncbi:hypothetical protein B0A49_08440 [Cryomyces minteri]|uniref:Uncharacterized protein n=1 Tax=Cryomyces minteri TaxID=331657 RepID=A0A4U0X8K5_9PEZI|nr:hypothetical protein B0A49_08440 [Cryomyces minteri]